VQRVRLRPHGREVFIARGLARKRAPLESPRQLGRAPRRLHPMCDERDLDPALGQLDEAFALGGLRRSSNGMFSLLHRTMTRSFPPTRVGGVFFKSKGDSAALAAWYRKHMGMLLECRREQTSKGTT
jgi:hypothetical protein